MPERTASSARGSARDRITLTPSPASAAAARRFVEDHIAGWSLPGSAGELLVLVASELVTNALLHARTPLTLSLERHRDHVRIGVQDASPAPAALRRYRSDALTGRGLAVVAALSRRWGVEAAPDGKVVWAELDTTGAAPGSPRLPEPGPVPPAPPPAGTPGAREVRFIGVPVAAYLELQAHNDALFRELELVRIELDARDGARGVSPLAGLVDRLYRPFRSQRDGYRDVVAAAQASGQDTVDLSTSASPAAVPAARAYLELLEQADELCRRGVLLTPEPSEPVRSLRRWFVDQMAAQLLDGTPPAGPR
jgi:hypothetical protein